MVFLDVAHRSPLPHLSFHAVARMNIRIRRQQAFSTSPQAYTSLRPKRKSLFPSRQCSSSLSPPSSSPSSDHSSEQSPLGNNSATNTTNATATINTKNELTTVLTLALPALAIVLSDPLQTLVDSAAVGRQSTIQLAALGPNTAIFNAIFQIFSFLGIATANFVATNSLAIQGLSVTEQKQRREAASNAISTAFLLAIILGIFGTCVVLCCGPSWLHAMGTSPEVLPLSTEYLLIRTWATVFVLITNVAQGVCLGRQDTITPMWMCLFATLLNVGGDGVLVWGLKWGIRGAAGATVAAQAFACFFILRQLSSAAHNNNNGDDATSEYIPIRFPFLSFDVRTLSYHQNIKPFVDVGATLVTRTAVGMISYFAMTVAAVRLGTMGAAAHQIAMQLFWFISFFPEPLSMAAQSLIAKEITRNKGRAAALARVLVRYGCYSGCILACIVGIAFHWGPALFTRDPLLRASVQALAPLGMLSMAVCGVMMALDGVSVGAGSYRHLPLAVGAGLASVLGVLGWGWRGGGATLASVWWSLIAFYSVRLAGHLVYYALNWKSSVFCYSADGRGSGSSGGSDNSNEYIAV